MDSCKRRNKLKINKLTLELEKRKKKKKKKALRKISIASLNENRAMNISFPKYYYCILFPTEA